MDTITIYSTSTCQHCKEAKDFFRAHNIDYTEVDVTSNPEEGNRVFELIGKRTVPVIRIGSEDVFVGFNEDQLKSLLKI